MKKNLGRAFAVLLVGGCAFTAYQNVYSDDAAVRDLAQKTARAAAGCGDACKIVGLRGERGMIHETIAYDIDGKGAFTIACRRAFVIAGDYACAREPN